MFEGVQLMSSRSGRIVQLKQQFAADSAAHDALSAEATDAHSSGSGKSGSQLMQKMVQLEFL